MEHGDLLVVFALAPAVVGMAWGVVGGIVLPRMIPHDEIERLADDLMARYPIDPEKAAIAEEYAAWHRSEIVEQGKWRRVRTAIRGRLK